MFGRKEAKEADAMASRLSAIKNAPPVQFCKLHAEFSATKRKADRETERTPAYKFGIVMTRSGEELNCVVRDISEAGAKIVMEGAIGLPPKFRLVIDGYRAPTDVSLAWQKDREAGVAFE